MKIISLINIFFILSILSLSTLAYEVQKEIYLTEDQLPHNNSLGLTFNFTSGYSIFLTQIKTNSHVTLSFPMETIFNETNTTIIINYSLEKFFLEFQETVLETSLNITNNLNNVTKEYGLFFRINKTSQNIINFNQTFDLISSDDGYNITISQDLLPRIDSVKFNLKGNVGTIVEVKDCGEWLFCPGNVTFQSNMTEINVAYNVPGNISNGEYVRFITFKTNTTEKKSAIQFKIVEVDFIIREFEQKCINYTNIDEQLNCFSEMERYILQKQKELVQKKFLQEKNNSNNTKFEYVMVGSVDFELQKIYNSLSEEALVLRRDNIDKTRLIENLQAERDGFNARLTIMEQGITERESLLLNQTMSMINEENQRRRTQLVIGSIVVLGIVAGAGWIWYNAKLNEVGWI